MALSQRAKKIFLNPFVRRCPGCGSPEVGDSAVLCAWCSLRVYPDGERIVLGRPVLTAFRHSGIPRELILRLKFSGERVLASSLARLSLLSWRRVPEKGDTIVPVPSARRRLRERGYNQAALIAGAVAGATGARLEKILTRRPGESQIGLSGRERIENIRGQFTLSGPAVFSGRTWLIDDVMTTGATITEISAVLEDAGIRRIIPAVVCFRNTEDESIIQGKEVDDGGV